MRLPRIRSLFHLIKIYLTHPNLWRVMRGVRRQHLTYLGLQALGDLAAEVAELENKKTEGIFLEAGCALGGSAIVIAAAKSSTRPLFVYDTFEQIPPPSPTDGQDAQERYAQIASGRSAGLGGEEYYGYRKDLYQQVRHSFDQFGFPVTENRVCLVKGLFQDTLEVNQPVAFAHLDCDWYESVLVCLQRIEPHLAQQGCLIVDDYFDWSGCRKAVDEYFATRRDLYKFEKTSRLLIRRK